MGDFPNLFILSKIFIMNMYHFDKQKNSPTLKKYPNKP